MTKCRLGTDLTGARTRGYSHLLYTEFPDFDTHDRLPRPSSAPGRSWRG